MQCCVMAVSGSLKCLTSGCSPSQESSAEPSVLTGVDSVETGKQRPFFRDLSYLCAYLFGCVGMCICMLVPAESKG